MRNTLLSGLCATLTIMAVLLSATPAQATRPLDTIVAVVNEQVILASELETELATIKQRLQKQSVQLPPEQVLKKQVLQRMVMRELQMQIAARAGVRVSDDRINQTMARIAERNGVSLSQLPEKLAEDGISYAQFRENLRQEITISIVQRGNVLQNINVTEREINQYLAFSETNGGMEYHLSHILVALPSEPGPEEISVKKKRAEQIMEMLQDEGDFAQTAVAYSDGAQALSGGDLGWRSQQEIPSLFVPAVTSLDKGEISGIIRSPGGFHIIKLHDKRALDEEKVVVTQTHARHILITPNAIISDADAKAKLAELRARALAGEDFAELATEYSDDTGSATQGGDLDWANPGTFAPAFEATLDRLQPGEISKPFKTQFGWHIAKLIDRRKQDLTEKTRRNRAEQAIRQRKFQEQLPIWMQRMWDKAYLEFHIPGMQA